MQLAQAGVCRVVSFVSQQLFSSKAEMPSVIQSNDIQAKLTKSFFFRTISCNKRLGYRRNGSLLKMEPRNCANNLNLPANM
jgi:hypothetical protein